MVASWTNPKRSRAITDISRETGKKIMANQQSLFAIDLEYEELKVFYTGSKNRVQVTAHDGRSINLPWSMLQPYLTTSGIQGRFLIRYTQEGKLLRLDKLD
jgi:hypothetical protein